MINLKSKINKAATFKKLKQIAEDRYKEDWRPEIQQDAFIDGAKALLELLRLPIITQQSEQYCKCEKPILGEDISKCGTCNKWFSPFK